MNVVILCGGQGLRLRELTEHVPKPAIEVGGRPLLWHIMKTYAHFGLKDFTLCLGHRGDVIRNYFLQYDLMRDDFTIELGKQRIIRHTSHHNEVGWRVCMAETGEGTMTGGRLKRIEKYISDETFMLTYGDGVADVNINELLKFHQREGCIATVTGVRPVGRFGEFDVEGDRALRFVEKPELQDRWVNGGFFVFNRAIFEYLDGDACVLERKPLAQLADTGQLAVYRHEGYWRCMDTLHDVGLLNAEWAQGNAAWAVWQARA